MEVEERRWVVSTAPQGSTLAGAQDPVCKVSARGTSAAVVGSAVLTVHHLPPCLHTAGWEVNGNAFPEMTG